MIKRITTAVLAFQCAVLAGCAAPMTQQQSSPAARQCEYEATMATQFGASPMVLGFRRAELFQQCMRAKGG